jgi:hypothetical protein
MPKDHHQSIHLIACLCSLSTAAIAAETGPDWPCLRGPNHDACVSPSNLTFPWPNGQPVRLWKATIGDGYSGVIVVGDRIFTQEQTRGGQAVVCLDLNTGKYLWRSRYNFPWQVGGSYPGPYGTPTYDDGKIFFSDCYGTVGCVTADHGNPLWSDDLTAQFKGAGNDFGYPCSPLIDDGRVILPFGGKGSSVVALSAKTGAFLWKTGDDPASVSSSLPIVVEGHRQIVSFLQNVLVAHDPETGAELWRNRWSPDGYDEHAAAPLYHEPFLFCAAPFRQGTRVLKLTYDKGAAKAELVWQNHALCNDVFSSVLVNGFVYGADVRLGEAKANGGTPSEFKCVELATGRECWASRAPGYANVVGCSDKLLLFNEKGELLVLAATPNAYTELARVPVIGSRTPCWTAPTVCRGRLLVRNHQSLVCCQIGPVSDNAAFGSARETAARKEPSLMARRARSWVKAPFDWLDRHQNSDLSVPSLAELRQWYWYCLALFAFAGVTAWGLRKKYGDLKTFAVTSLLLGLLGLPLFSELTGTVIFTWPVGCHAAFVVLLAAENQKMPAPTTRLKGLVPLLFFVLFCLGYYLFCCQLYILIGLGFLVGFLPALPATRLFVRSWQQRAGAIRTIAFGLLSFSLYFWGSAFQILWRTAR